MLEIRVCCKCSVPLQLYSSNPEFLKLIFDCNWSPRFHGLSFHDYRTRFPGVPGYTEEEQASQLKDEHSVNQVNARVDVIA